MTHILIQIFNLPNGDSEIWRINEEQEEVINKLKDIGAINSDVMIERLDIILMD